MSMIKKIATAGAVAAMGLGLGAASASAYSISGGTFTGTATSQHTFTVGGAYTIGCDAVFNGTANGSATAGFTPSFTNCDFFGFGADVTINAPWSLTVTSDNGAGRYYGSITIPSASPSAVVIEVPLIGCEVYVNGVQTFAHGAGGNALYGDNGSPFKLYGDVYNINYTTNGLCPFGSGSDGEYHTNGAVNIPGVTVS